MPNKIASTLTIWLVVYTSACLTCVFSQGASLSSISGLGQHSTKAQPLYLGLGGQSVSYIYPNTLNTYNPASYSFLKYQYPVFSIGVVSHSSTIKENNNSEFLSNTALSDIAFGLSFAQRFGFAFGFQPAYETNYDFTQTVNVSASSLKYRYQGAGTTNKGYLGFSVKVINKNAVQWSIGSNFGTLFGRTEHLRKSVVVNNFNNAGGVEAKIHQLRSFHYEFGTVLQLQLNQGQQLTFGANFDPQHNLKSTYNQSLYYADVDVDNIKNWKLLTERGERKGHISQPQQYQFGVSYAKNFQDKKKNNDSRQSQILLLAEYWQSRWSNYQEQYSDSTFSYGFKNGSGFQIGVQYTPETSYIGNVMPKLIERSNYRIGFSSSTLPYHHDNAQFSQWAISLGFGVPLLIERRLDSSLQLSIAAGQRNNTHDHVIQENFITLGLGILITPGTSDRWFIKRKLD